MTGLATPIGNGTDIAEVINDKAYSRALIADASGADAVGAVAASPASYTILGRLKAVATAIADMATAVTNAISLTTGADNFKALTPGSADLSPIPKALFIGTEGTITLVGANGNAETFPVDAKSIISVRARKLTAATATGIIGLY